MPITKKINPNANVKQRSDSDEQGSGSSGTSTSFGINYVLNPGAETDTSGWATYANTAQSTPVNGTGGSPNVTYTRDLTNPLRGQASFLFSKDAANRQGQGVSYDFTIDSADKAKVLGFQFDYIVDSGSFNAGSVSTDSDVEMWVFDKTNNLLIPVTPFKLVSNSSVNPETFKGTFQTSNNSVSYRLILHVATTNASAWGLKLDNFLVGPQAIINAPSVSDEKVYPLVIGAVTTPPTLPSVVNYNQAIFRIVGDNIEIDWTYYAASLTGAAAGSGTYLFPLPPGYSADLSLVTANSNQDIGSHVGRFEFHSSSQSKDFFGYVYLYDATHLAAVAFTDNFVPALVGSGSYAPTTDANSYNIQARIPIAGLSSNTLTGNDADARVVAALIGLTTSQAVGSGGTVKFDTVQFDTHAAYNTSNGIYTVPVSGKYKVTVSGIANNPGSYYVVRNSVFDNAHGSKFIVTIKAGEIHNGSTSVDCVSGDTLEIRNDSSLTITGNNPFESYVCFEKLSGPALPLATETVAARYYQASATQSVPSGNLTSTNLITVNFDTKDYDTHGAVSNPSSNWMFTAPRADWYELSVNTAVHFTTNGTGAATMLTRVLKNGVDIRTQSLGLQTTIGGNSWDNSISDKIYLMAGDTLQVTVAQNTGISGNTSTTASSVWFSNFSNVIAIKAKG